MPNATASTRDPLVGLPLSRITLGPGVKVLALHRHRAPAEAYCGMPTGTPVSRPIFADLLAGYDPAVTAPTPSR